ncbi:MAG: Asp-tRNA(Asn)/Glu-tRNA(Gln) amidotransferase subunit GatA [Minisyncoccia bacterium]
MADFSKLSIGEIKKAFADKKFSSLDITKNLIELIKKNDAGKTDAFLEVFDEAPDAAREADKNLKKGKDSPLLGVPIALKDNILVSGKRATAASKILEGFISPYDATVVKRLKDAGAVIVGRTNMDEFAMGSSTENSVYGPTKNPHDPTRVPGGSSGGSAVAVAAGFVPVALGSDTGGSIRQPAAFSGVVGLKPSYGRVSRSGLIALASSLDQIGPFTRSVADAELVYKVIAGRDPLDSTTVSDESFPRKRKFSKTIGIPREFIEIDGIDESVKKNFEEAVEKFRALGYKIKDLKLPHLKYSLAVYYIIMPAEASSNLARFDGVKYGFHKAGKDVIEDYFETRGAGFGPEPKRRIILGTYVLSSGYYDEYYGSALEMKKLISEELAEAFEKVDLILTPTTPTPAFKLGEKTKDPLSMYLADIFTVPANIAGLPSISLPSGLAGVLPLGIELTAALGREDDLFLAGKEFLGE